MRIRLAFMIVALGLLVISCGSGRNGVRGDSGRATAVDARPGVSTALKGKADNEYTKALLGEAYKWLGTPYKYGGENKNGADCSGFVMKVYLDALDVKLPRVSREQGAFCKKIDKSDLFPGDLIFFNTGKSGKVTHVGIYLGEGKMIHASASKGVVVSDIDTKYWDKAYHHSGKVEAYHRLVSGKNLAENTAGVNKRGASSGKKSKKKTKK